MQFIRFALLGALLLVSLPLVGAALAGAVLVLILCAMVIKLMLFSGDGEQPSTEKSNGSDIPEGKR